jgi:hypothetical protein
MARQLAFGANVNPTAASLDTALAVARLADRAGLDLSDGHDRRRRRRGIGLGQ